MQRSALRVVAEFKRRTAGQRVAEVWNTEGTWYVTRGFAEEQLYFLATGKYQKNGSAIGVLVSHQLDRPRAKPKAKKYRADRQWQQSFTKVPLSEVPPKVVASAKPVFAELLKADDDAV